MRTTGGMPGWRAVAIRMRMPGARIAPLFGGESGDRQPGRLGRSGVEGDLGGEWKPRKDRACSAGNGAVTLRTHLWMKALKTAFLPAGR
jgi:hypothetical protein